VLILRSRRRHVGAVIDKCSILTGSKCVQDQQRLRGIMYKVYAKRATALQNSAFAAWRSAAAFAHERRAALRALILCSRHRRLQSAIDKYGPSSLS